jgi:hypothetical protein
MVTYNRHICLSWGPNWGKKHTWGYMFPSGIVAIMEGLLYLHYLPSRLRGAPSKIADKQEPGGYMTTILGVIVLCSVPQMPGRNIR